MVKRYIVPFLFVIIISFIFVIPVLAAPASGNSIDYQPSNDCLACHTSFDKRLENVPKWYGGIEHNQVIPCPALSMINEDLYYTERLFLAIDRAQSSAPSDFSGSKNEKRLAAAEQNYSRLLDTPISNLEAFSSENKSIRYQLGKVYTSLTHSIDSAKRERIIWSAAIISIFMIGALVWGWLNARNALKKFQFASKKRGKLIFTWAAVLALIFLIFALPIFRVPTQEVETPDQEEQDRNALVDEARRAALTADKELSRSWMLAKIGSEWVKNNPNKGETALEKSLLYAKEAHLNNPTLWGFAQSAWEASGIEENKLANAAIIGSKLDSVRGRSWALRTIAEIWMGIDETESVSILESAINQTESAVFPYDQLDLRSISETWARIDPEKGFQTAKKIIDPALRSWAFREIALITGDEIYFSEAVDAARQVNDPIINARCLWKIGILNQDDNLIIEGLGKLQETEGLVYAYGLADFAIETGNLSLVSKIPAQYPNAVAFAYFSLNEYENAWSASQSIVDPYEKARAQAMIAGEWGNFDASVQIANPLLRDRALRDIIKNTGNYSLIDDIRDSYYKIQVLTSNGELDEAWSIIDNLSDGYPLISLGTLAVERDPKTALLIVDELDREADKAVVLRAIAAASGKQEDYERALGMALAARVRGNALSPVEASLLLAEAVHSNSEKYEEALSQAYNTANNISIIY